MLSHPRIPTFQAFYVGGSIWRNSNPLDKDQSLPLVIRRDAIPWHSQGSTPHIYAARCRESCKCSAAKTVNQLTRRPDLGIDQLGQLPQLRPVASGPGIPANPLPAFW